MADKINLESRNGPPDNLHFGRIEDSKSWFLGIRGDISFLDEVIVVGEKGKGVSSYRDRQYLALFEQKEFLRLMREAGFKARHLMKSLTDKRGLYVGVKEESAEVL